MKMKTTIDYGLIVGTLGSFDPDKGPGQTSTLHVFAGGKATMGTVTAPFFIPVEIDGKTYGMDGRIPVNLSETTDDPDLVSELAAAADGGGAADTKPYDAGSVVPVQLDARSNMSTGMVDVRAVISPAALSDYNTAKSAELAQKMGRPPAREGVKQPVAMRLGSVTGGPQTDVSEFAGNLGVSVGAGMLLQNPNSTKGLTAEASDAACREFLALSAEYMEANAEEAAKYGIRTHRGPKDAFPRMTVIDMTAYRRADKDGSLAKLKGGLDKYVNGKAAEAMRSGKLDGPTARVMLNMSSHLVAASDPETGDLTLAPQVELRVPCVPSRMVKSNRVACHDMDAGSAFHPDELRAAEDLIRSAGKTGQLERRPKLVTEHPFEKVMQGAAMSIKLPPPDGRVTLPASLEKRDTEYKVLGSATREDVDRYFGERLAEFRDAMNKEGLIPSALKLDEDGKLEVNDVLALRSPEGRREIERYGMAMNKYLEKFTVGVKMEGYAGELKCVSEWLDLAAEEPGAEVQEGLSYIYGGGGNISHPDPVPVRADGTEEACGPYMSQGEPEAPAQPSMSPAMMALQRKMSGESTPDADYELGR